MKALAQAVILVELGWTALFFGWLLLFGDSSDRMAWLGFFWFVFWTMTQAVMFPAMLLAVFYLGVDWFFGRRLDEIRRAP